MGLDMGDTMANRGIDYGMGNTNVDRKTGIRYGVISQHSVLEAWYDSAESIYPEPEYCPTCDKPTLVKSDTVEDANRDYWCPECQEGFWNDCFDMEPSAWVVDDGEYSAENCLDSDIIITQSPYYTYGQYCSPCVPGAVNLETPLDPESGVKGYCFGHDWFEGGVAPYVVYRVADDSIVTAE